MTGDGSATRRGRVAGDFAWTRTAVGGGRDQARAGGHPNLAYPFCTRERIRATQLRRGKPTIEKSRRPDSNPGPLHYEGKPSEGRAHTRARAGTFSLETISRPDKWTRVPA